MQLNPANRYSFASREVCSAVVGHLGEAGITTEISPNEYSTFWVLGSGVSGTAFDSHLLIINGGTYPYEKRRFEYSSPDMLERLVGYIKSRIILEANQ
jgi:hypothetical protein